MVKIINKKFSISFKTAFRYYIGNIFKYLSKQIKDLVCRSLCFYKERRTLAQKSLTADADELHYFDLKDLCARSVVLIHLHAFPFRIAIPINIQYALGAGSGDDVFSRLRCFQEIPSLSRTFVQRIGSNHGT